MEASTLTTSPLEHEDSHLQVEELGQIVRGTLWSIGIEPPNALGRSFITIEHISNGKQVHLVIIGQKLYLNGLIRNETDVWKVWQMLEQ